jgi:hypothetical protein
LRSPLDEDIIIDQPGLMRLSVLGNLDSVDLQIPDLRKRGISLNDLFVDSQPF